MKGNDRNTVAIQIRLAKQLQNRALRARDTIGGHAAGCIDRKYKKSALLVL
jgi:hypothetical protein